MTANQIIEAFRTAPATAERAKKVPRLVTSEKMARDIVKALSPEESELILPLLQSKFGSF